MRAAVTLVTAARLFRIRQIRGLGQRDRRLDLIGLEILLLHFLVYDRMPLGFALPAGDVMFTCPAPQLQLFDEINFRHDRAYHDPSPHELNLESEPFSTLSEYIGGHAEGKDQIRIPRMFFSHRNPNVMRMPYPIGSEHGAGKNVIVGRREKADNLRPFLLDASNALS